MASSAGPATDDAGRIRDSGYTYDTLGRTLTTPRADTGSNAAGDLTATYHADDMIASLTQNVTNTSGGTDGATMTYGLDPAERINTITTAINGTETNRLRYRFAGDDDTPTSIDASTDRGATWTTLRQVSIPELGLVAITSAGANNYQLANMHGDIVATAASDGSLDQYGETTEYGQETGDASNPRYGWLGSHQRSTDTVGGGILMGARLYGPAAGRFYPPDSISGGGANPYAYPTDPINSEDMDGRFWRDVRKWRIRFAPDGSKGKFGFNKSETRFLAGLKIASLAGYCGGKGGPWVGAVCGAAGFVLYAIANRAVDRGKCVRYRWWVAPWVPMHGFFYSGSCKQGW